MALIGYVEEVDFEAYATVRGITLSRPTSETLTLALDYIELQSYSGAKTDPLQELEFPRNGDTEVPASIKKAQMVAAALYDSGEDLLAPQGAFVTQETVVGAVSVSYSENGVQSTVYGQLNKLLKPFLSDTGGMFQFEVCRG